MINNDYRAWFPPRLQFFLQQLNAHHQIEDLHYFPVFQAAEARLAHGFDVLESIQQTPSVVVFTTAHKNYAINALRKGAFDYLIKPINLDELNLQLKKLAAFRSRMTAAAFARSRSASYLGDAKPVSALTRGSTSRRPPGEGDPRSHTPNRS